MERPDLNSLKLNYWYDELIWCPSQCYYFFDHLGEHFCLYLRWRHQDPWTAEIIHCPPDSYDTELQDTESKYIKIPYFADHELEKLKEFLEHRLSLICLLFPYQEHHVGLHIEEYKVLPDDVRAKTISLEAQILQNNAAPKRKIKTHHVGEIKGFDTLLQMEVRNYLDKHPKELGVDDGIYVNPDTADITVTNAKRLPNSADFYPFTSLAIWDRTDWIYQVDKEATKNIAFSYYEYE